MAPKCSGLRSCAKAFGILFASLVYTAKAAVIDSATVPPFLDELTVPVVAAQTTSIHADCVAGIADCYAMPAVECSKKMHTNFGACAQPQLDGILSGARKHGDYYYIYDCRRDAGVIHRTSHRATRALVDGTTRRLTVICPCSLPVYLVPRRSFFTLRSQPDPPVLLRR